MHPDNTVVVQVRTSRNAVADAIEEDDAADAEAASADSSTETAPAEA